MPNEDQLSDNLRKLMERGFQQEVETASIPISQNLATLRLLKEKGLIDDEDIKKWEAWAEEAKEIVTYLAMASTRVDQTEEVLELASAKIEMLEHTLALARFLGNQEVGLQEIIRSKRELEDFVEKAMASDTSSD